MTNLKVFSDPSELQSQTETFGCALAIGNYDGVHFGHRTILQSLADLAKVKNLPSYLLTFDPHPAKILAPTVAPAMLNTKEQKIELLADCPIDGVIFQKFTETFAKSSPEEFVNETLVKKLNAKLILVGYDFTFGDKRSGTIETLEKLCRPLGIEVQIIKAQMCDDILVNSSTVRRVVLNGQMKEARRFLSRPYFIEGPVVKGHQRGAALGIHTANIDNKNELLPPDGVYATFVDCEGKRYTSVTNIGFNPTFHNTERSIEAHIFNFDLDIYQKNLRIHFTKRLRDEIQFATPAALVQQIEKDIKQAKETLAKDTFGKS